MIELKPSELISDQETVNRRHCVRILVVVEGENDIAFLRRISFLLHYHDQRLPDLTDWERRGRLVFLPFGGSGLTAWTQRLQPLLLPEFHLYDRERPPETGFRQIAACAVNTRPGCRAVLTNKQALENYLHPQAVRAALGIEVAFDDVDTVGEVVARELYERKPHTDPWETLPYRTRKRQSNAAKRRLNTRAASAMTVEWLQQRDPDCEVASWLTAIAELAESR